MKKTKRKPIKTDDSAPVAVPFTHALLIESFGSHGKEPIDWNERLKKWLEIRPHSTGLVEMPFWEAYCSVSATEETATDHKNPERGRIWM